MLPPRFLSCLCLAVITVAGCSDRQGEAPTAPRSPAFAAAVTKPACNYQNILTKDIPGYWPNSGGTAVKAAQAYATTLVKTMQAAAGLNPADSSTITFAGFRVLDTLARTAAAADTIPSQPTTPAAGSTLALDLLICMDVPAAAVPTSFVAALGHNGAFGVRGLTTNDLRPSGSKDSVWNVSPVSGPWSSVAKRAPLSSPDSGGSAAASLQDTAKRVFLLFGQPFSSATSFTASGDSLRNQTVVGVDSLYSWSAVPAQVFQTSSRDPGILLSQCGPAGYVQGFLQHNPQGSGKAEILQFAPANCPSLPMWFSKAGLLGPPTLAHRLWHLLVPEPAYAVVLGGGSGTKSTGLSPWGVIFPGAVNLTNATWPSKSGNTVNVAFSPTITDTARSNGGVPFKGPTVFAWLEAINNQGVNVLVCNNWAFTEPNGALEFKKAFLNKAGGYTLTMKTVGTNVSNPGTPPVPAGSPISSPLFNVKNAGTVSGSGCDTTTVNVYINGRSQIPTAPTGTPSGGNPYWANGTLTQ